MTIDLEQRRKDIAERYARHGGVPPLDARTAGTAPTAPAPAPTAPAASPVAVELPFDPGEMTVADLEWELTDVVDATVLARLYQAEKAGKNRKTALRAIEARTEALQEGLDD